MPFRHDPILEIKEILFDRWHTSSSLSDTPLVDDENSITKSSNSPCDRKFRDLIHTSSRQKDDTRQSSFINRLKQEPINHRPCAFIGYPGDGVIPILFVRRLAVLDILPGRKLHEPLGCQIFCLFWHFFKEKVIGENSSRHEKHNYDCNGVQVFFLEFHDDNILILMLL